MAAPGKVKGRSLRFRPLAPLRGGRLAQLSGQSSRVWTLSSGRLGRDDEHRLATDIIDEFTHERLAIRVACKLKTADVIDVLSDPIILRSVPSHIRPDNEPEIVAQAVRDSIAAVDARTACIAPGSPWENGYVEASNARFGTNC